MEIDRFISDIALDRQFCALDKEHERTHGVSSAVKLSDHKKKRKSPSSMNVLRDMATRPKTSALLFDIE